MKNRPLLYLAVSFYLTAHYLDTCFGQTTTYVMDSFPINKRKTIKLPYNSFDSSIVLKASERRYPFDGQYSFTVNVPTAWSETYRIHGTVQSFRIRNADRLIITSTSGIANETIYDSRSPPIYFYSFNTDLSYDKALIFELKLVGYERFDGFEITLTTARYWLGREHQSSEFYCLNQYCIKDVWSCNGRDNCGNDYDETSEQCSKATKIGFSVGGVLLAAVLIVIIVVVCRKRRRRPTTLANATTVIIPTRGNTYSGSLAPVPNPVPATMYPYNTNQADWQQFPHHIETAPPPYQNVPNEPFNPNNPQNQKQY